MAAGVKFGGYPSKQAQDEAIASGGPSRIDGKTLRTDMFDPNLRDEGAGFFSTLFTAGSNIGTDALTELGYIAQAVARPKDTAEAILRVAAGYAQKALPDNWEAYLPEDWATNKMYANAINDYYAEKYGSIEQAADSFAEQPVSVALDVFAVKALLTAVTRQAVRKSNATTKMAVTAKNTPLEGELAARAAADLKVAQELEKTVKYEGKLVFDEALGAYVPEAEVAARTTLDAAEVAPIVSAIDEAVPTMNNSPIPTEGMLNVTKVDEGVPLASAADVAQAKKNARAIEEKWMDIEDLTAQEAFYQTEVIPAKVAAIDAEIAAMAPDAVRAIRDANIRKVAIQQEVRYSEAAGLYNETLSNAELAAQAKQYPIISDAQAANMIRNGARAEDVADNARMALDIQEALAARNAVPDVAVPAATTGLNLQGTRATDGSLLSTIPDNLLEGTLSTVARGSDDSLAATEIAKLSRDNAALQSYMATRRADDAKMAAASQADLFSTGTAAQYELAQASRIASDLAKVSPDVPAVVGTRMLATSPETKLAKYADVERRTTPPSIPQTKLNVDIKKVAPAVQRVAAASSQQAERGADNSFLPMTPDKGIDLIDIKSRYEDMPPYEKSIDNREIGKKDEGETRPGWKLPHQFEGSTREGNYWSADFEDEHWNTPAGINEAMGIWGRPVGNRIVNPR